MKGLFHALQRFSGNRCRDLEVHVPISPNENFFTMVLYLALSLRIYGGCRDVPLVVTVGEDQEPDDLEKMLPWSRELNIHWRWVDREHFRQWWLYGNAVERFRQPFSRPYVLMLDADVLAVDRLGPMIKMVAESGKFYGLPAHVSPFDNDEPWHKIFAAAGLTVPDFSCRHSGWGVISEAHKPEYCPPYFNLGVLLAPSDHMTAIGKIIYRELDHIAKVMDTYYRCQIAVTLALIRLGLPWGTLPLRYNFPNDPAFAAAYPEELEQLSLLHYLRTGEVNKSQDFKNPHVLDTWLHHAHASGVNALLKERVSTMHERALDHWRRNRLRASNS